MLENFLRGHLKYRRKVLAKERDFLQKLASEGQSPDAMYIGCSDSRVVPEQLTSSTPGEIFVIRNVANMVPPLENADASVGAALDYAVEHLKVQHLIVCGHYGCGGIKALMTPHPHFAGMPSLAEWLAPAHRTVMSVEQADPNLWWRQAVERNVVQQLANLMTFPQVAAAWEEDRLEVHGWVYDMYTFNLHVFDESSGVFLSADQLLER
jgi:carbonic anhydrase